MSDEMLVRYCSPTLAGMKTGSLFNCPFDSVEELRSEIRNLNRRLATKGLRILPLKIQGSMVLIYVYRPGRLKADLSGSDAGALLRSCGYRCDHPEKCVVRLISRLQGSSDFPHEIGLFLGYPPEDVRGFIENNAQCAKCVGCWKVYGDEQKAKRLFAKYKKCTAVYCRCLEKGSSIEHLTVG